MSTGEISKDSAAAPYHPRLLSIRALDCDQLTVRAAQACTGIAAADFSRIRNADLGRITAARLIRILNRLGSRVEVRVRVRPVESAA